jgi:alkylation response protein AidB-like acyl-CoA dehydrogenase
VVYANSNPKVGMLQGTSSFLVPRDTPGLTVARCNETLGCRFMNNGELVFEEAFVVVPGLLGRSLRQARKVVRIGYRFTAAALRDFCQQSEIQTFHRLAALKRQLRSDATIILEARNFVTPSTAVVANPAFAFVPQTGVIHKRRFGIAGRFLLLEGDEIAGDVFRILRR